MFKSYGKKASVSDALHVLATKVVQKFVGTNLYAARVAAERLSRKEMTGRLLKPQNKLVKKRKLEDGGCDVLALMDRVR